MKRRKKVEISKEQKEIKNTLRKKFKLAIRRSNFDNARKLIKELESMRVFPITAGQWQRELDKARYRRIPVAPIEIPRERELELEEQIQILQVQLLSLENHSKNVEDDYKKELGKRYKENLDNQYLLMQLNKQIEDLMGKKLEEAKTRQELLKINNELKDNIRIQQEDAKKLNADAIVGVRITTSNVMQGSSEILAYGTAVKFGK